jgi:hypothetical protein
MKRIESPAQRPASAIAAHSWSRFAVSLTQRRPRHAKLLHCFRRKRIALKQVAVDYLLPEPAGDHFRHFRHPYMRAKLCLLRLCHHLEKASELRLTAANKAPARVLVTSRTLPPGTQRLIDNLHYLIG